MSSTGQIVGGIVGGVIGFFFLGGNAYAGAIKGAAIGASIGGYIDPPPGPNLYGPTLDDKSFQSTAYGVSLATLHGSIATTGNIIYLENNEYKAVARKESTGGKGGGSQGSYTTTTYFATFAVALGEAMPGAQVRRIWLGGKLFYSVGVGDIGSLMESSKASERFAFHDGSQTEPDSRMESIVGTGRTPSYEGTAYIIFYDLDLTPYGNGLAGAPVKVELVSGAELVVALLDEGVLRRTDADSETGYGCILPMDISGNGYRYSFEIGSQSLRIDSRDVFGGVKLNSQVTLPDSVSSLLRGYSDVSRYACLTNFVDGDEFRSIAHIGSAAIQNPFVDGLALRAVYQRIYEVSGAQIFLLRASAVQDVDDPEFTPNSWLLWRSTDDRGRYLQDENFGDSGTTSMICVGYADYLTDDVIVTVSRESLPATISVFSQFDPENPAGYTELDTFTCELNRPIDNTRAALLHKNKIYHVNSYFADLQSGLISLGVIDLVGQQQSVYQFSVPPVTGETASDECAIARFGNIICIAFHAPNYAINFYYLNTEDLTDISPVPLSEITAHYLMRSGIGSEFFNVDELADLVDGYRFSGPGSSRGALSPLQVAYLFDLVETGYTLTAVKRGGVSDEVVPWQHLDARKSGESPTVLVKRDYETDSQLPSRYSITYLDYNREYDTNTQYAPFPSRRVNERNESLAIVMDADRAAQLADVLGNLAWVERNTFVFILPQLYLGWRPDDVKTVELSPGNLASLRINDITYTEDQCLEINARLAEPAVYQSGATGVPADPPSEVVPFVGPSVAVLMDIPMILDSTDIPGFVGAMYGAGSWPGGVLFRSIDNGQTYTGIQAFTGQATIGEALNALGPSDGLIIDRSSQLTIQPLAGTFGAITEAQMLTGQHYCAYGVDGRWEIIRYADSVLNSDGTRTLSTFIRGYRGTEWATGLHEIADYVVLLDDPDNAFIGSDLSQLAIERLYKPVTVGQDLASAESFEFAYNGINLKPLSPVLPLGEIVSNDWLIEWTPRTRYSSNYWYTGVQPQNESVMAWEVDVLDGSTVVRTLSSSTPAVTYTEAQQIEDFGSAQSTIAVVIYQVSQRVGRGYPLEVTF